MLHVITLCHMEPAIIAASLMQMKRTEGFTSYEHTLVDHYWPIDPGNCRECLRLLRPGRNLYMPTENLGGTEGFNWALKAVRAELDDLVLWYDPDSWPVTLGWLKAMVEVMKADPTIATLSLWPADLTATDWVEETIAGHLVRTFPTHSEMFSVTMWRASFAFPRVEACHKYYGQIEVPAYRKALSLGMRNAWLADYKEDICPIPHPQVYEDWKAAHVAGRYLGNFKEYYEESLRVGKTDNNHDFGGAEGTSA